GDAMSAASDYSDEALLDISILRKLYRNGISEDRLLYIPGMLCRPPLRPDSTDSVRLATKTEIKRCFKHFISPIIEKLSHSSVGLTAIFASGPVASFSVVGRMDAKSL